LKPGDIVVGALSGAQSTKIRPAVVLSTEVYQRYRPDVVVGSITSQVPKPLAPTDCELINWREAGLRTPSYFRLFPVTIPQREVRLIGRLSDPDWQSARACFKVGLGGD
jgi:mRNA interferase MazF